MADKTKKLIADTFLAIAEGLETVALPPGPRSPSPPWAASTAKRP